MNELDQMPPSAIAAEEAIIGALLWDEKAYARIEADLRPEHFYFSGHRTLYEAISSMASKGVAADFVTVSQWLQDNNQLAAVGGREALSKLLDRSVSAVNIDLYAEQVIEKSKRRSLILYGSEVSRLGFDTSKPLPEALDSAEQSLFEITQGTDKRGPEHVSTVSSRVLERIANYDPSVLPGVPSGFYDLDAMTQGFQPSDLIIAAARPAMGKSALVDQVAHNSAESSGRPSVVFSLEMPSEQLVLRAISREARIELGRLRTRRITEAEYGLLELAQAKVDARPVFYDDSPTMTVQYIRSRCREMMAKYGQLGMVTIDYLQLMGGSEENRVQELSKITRSLKALARELYVPIIVLSQLSRGVESRTNKRPVMSDIRESGAIEQDADVIMMLYREDYYDPDTPDQGIAEVNIVKHRNGPTGTVKLLFEKDLATFRNKAKEQDIPTGITPKKTMHNVGAGIHDEY